MRANQANYPKGNLSVIHARQSRFINTSFLSAMRCTQDSSNIIIFWVLTKSQKPESIQNMNKNSLNGFISHYQPHVIVGEDHQQTHNINLTSSTNTQAHTRDNFQIPKFTHLVLTFYSHIPNSQIFNFRHKYYLIAPSKLAPSSLAPSKC